MVETPTPLLDSITQVSALLGVGRTTVYGLVKAGELVKVSIGRRAFITRVSVEAYVDRLSSDAQLRPSDVDG